jgi:hypothetical protein
MSTPRALRSAIVDLIKAAQLGFKDVTPHVGRYTVDDLKRMLRASPACAVGLVGGSKPKPCASGEVQIDLSFSAVIVTQSGRVEDADDDAIDFAIAVATKLTSWIPAKAVPTCQPAINIHVEPVGDDELDRAGLAVWVVLWSHTVRIGTDDIAAGISSAPPPGAPVVVTISDGDGPPTVIVGGEA